MIEVSPRAQVPGYRITGTLFVGEHVSVYRAVREADNRPVVLKQLRADGAETSALSRFLFSYEVGNRFQHPGIVRHIALLGGGRSGEAGAATPPTLVLEDQGGMDLFAYLRHSGQERLPVDEFLTIAVQLADALSLIHHQQVIHKDLHPGNILFNPATGLAQITDFGLASLLSREQPALQQPERIEGVLAYISPEQTGRMNRALDYRSDFYTLGCTFYHLLAGQPPFVAKDALGLVHAHIAKQQTPLLKLCEDIPPVVSAIIDKLLMKTAEDRYQSALGLKKDLEKVRLAVANNKPVPEFPLGMEDISDRLQVPQKLYGRENERQRLLQCFFQAAGGKPKLMAIAGYSGIGKSALVHEVHKPIATYSGFFCAGKFDQFQKNIPYSALQTALKGWIQHVLSLSEHKLDTKRRQLLESLGANARVLIDFMPDFEMVLGDLPPVAILGADETQNRFHLVFQQFIKEITSEHPLVLFIDDIQWADRGTLNLLPQLLSEERCRLLVIVAYRDNEVDANHPAMQTLNRIKQSAASQGVLSTVSLGPLAEAEVAELLADALHRPPLELAPLVKLIHAKTAGNPFFIGEFLKTLYTEKLLNFDLGLQRWCWKIGDIEAKGITDNVVDLMLAKMAQLPAETQAMIQLAACVGSRFSLEMLARIAEKRMAEVTLCLWPALRDGLLLQEGGDWFLGMIQPAPEQSMLGNSEKTVMSQFSAVSPQCRFLHDRMLQAAYLSMSEELRQQTHLRVGRLLLLQYKNIDALSDEECFAIVEQLNNARALICDEDEKLQLMRLNLRAAKQAKSASVWEAAADYSAQGLALLPEAHWQTTREESCALYLIKAEAEYLIGHAALSDQYYDALFAHVDDDFVRAEICAKRLVPSIGRGDWAAGIVHSLRGLSYLGLPMPEEADIQSVLAEEMATLHRLSSSGLVDSVSELPEMTDAKLLVAMRIMANLIPCYVILGKRDYQDYCVIKGCNWILAQGKSDCAAIILCHYAYYLRAKLRLRDAIVQGTQAKLLVDSYPSCYDVSNCYNILAGSICCLSSPFSECIEMHQKGTQLGLDNGEVARAVMNSCNALFAISSQGQSLSVVEREASQAANFGFSRGAFHPAGIILHLYSHALANAPANTVEALSDQSFDSALLAKVKGSFHLSYLLHYRSLLALWCGDEEQAFSSAKRAQAIEHIFPMNCFSIDHLFFYGFLLIQHWESLSELEKADVDKCRHKLAQFVDVYPPNFEHMALLLEAELFRAQSSNVDTICVSYRDAIASARQHGFIQFQALANERFGSYWLNKGFESIAYPFIQEALYLYRQWGCQAKVEQLRKQVNDFLPQFKTRIPLTISHSTLKESQESQALDMASVMKSAQLISSELQLNKLSAKVLEVIVECAGASSAALVINLNDHPHVVARVDGEGELVVPDKPLALDNCKQIPVNLVRYVLNSDEVVNLGDVISEKAFARDPYLLQHQPRSILCMPVEYRDRTVGALYLENNLTIDAFTPDRLDVIGLLLAQAAISFENSQLFTEVNQLNQTLEQKVEQRTDELEQAVRELRLSNEELDSFSRTVSHDLRAPLRGMRGFLEMLKEEFGAQLPPGAADLVSRTINKGNKMQDLVDGLLELSRVKRQEMHRTEVNLSEMVQSLFQEMGERYPGHHVKARCASGCQVKADERMLYSAMENLVNNAWKYTGKTAGATVEFGVHRHEQPWQPHGVGNLPGRLEPGAAVYFIRDNGAGFDMSSADNLFGTFKRLHADHEFVGTGVGLATVKRVIEMHGGHIWATAEVGKGACFFFTLPGPLPATPTGQD